ncbi:RNase adapter RapZ [Tsukamurella tyrosinosolvens]|nr:RNase adapter RapZ [Tsukamurella tyrosinosolvens]AUN43052.1 RNase adaptor protein RapZ [Tsukamurella tyrosinosolvens]KXP00458.1 RNase adaptor protein RapZ [Tsukamurella tyrosinosolvens]KXP04881.1 RNase adaptor protein RapZ [Tsukamurella tyrosinosolvens]KZL98928.1 RNase adaptor protein RapZ [Tsukamurella tyrosinosolvens]MCA4995845.1 RNase adapter RapZ [Tsukamurella tyrosinosolvens]
MDVLLVTGLSGAGRGTAAKVLEDLGWYVADNLPPALISNMVDISLSDESRIHRLCIVTDVRSRTFTGDFANIRRELAEKDIEPRVLFLDASDETLIRRFEQVRRKHPLQGSGTLAEGIAAERRILQPIRSTADLVLDTSTLSVARLRETIENSFRTLRSGTITVTVESFGFKNGILLDADMVLDVRFLPNPFWVPELRPLNGLTDEVSGYVLGQPGASDFLDTYAQLLDPLLAGYRREGKTYLTVGIGCTGGKHRSVAMTEELVRRLAGRPGIEVRAAHRDLGLE